MSSRPGLVNPPTRPRSVVLIVVVQRQGPGLPSVYLLAAVVRVGHEDVSELEVLARAPRHCRRRLAPEHQQRVPLQRSKNSKILRPALEAEQQPHHQHQDPYLQEAVLDHVMDEALQVVLVLVDVLPI